MRDVRETYDASLVELNAIQHAAAKTWFDSIQKARLQVSEHDEEPEFDFDDAITVAMDVLNYKDFIRPFVGVSDAELADNLEKVVHGVMANLQPFGG